MSADLAFDAVHWGIDADGDLFPLPVPLPVAAASDVRHAVPHLTAAGSAHIPGTGDVRAGVPVDHAVGTLVPGGGSIPLPTGDALPDILAAIAAEINNADLGVTAVAGMMPRRDYSDLGAAHVDVFPGPRARVELARGYTATEYGVKVVIAKRLTGDDVTAEVRLLEHVLTVLGAATLPGLPGANVTEVVCDQTFDPERVTPDQLCIVAVTVKVMAT